MVGASFVSSGQFCVEELEQSREFFESQNRLLKLLLALYSLLSAHSELLCYLIIVLNNVVSASVISVVLPILVFLWAMLALPRPSKRFWMTAIVYTEVRQPTGTHRGSEAVFLPINSKHFI